MKLAASVSFLALSLAGCATTVPPPAVAGPPAAGEMTAVATPVANPESVTAYPMTPAGAQAFVAAAEKDLLDQALIQSRADWVNATYVTDDTDALAAYFGAIGRSTK